MKTKIGIVMVTLCYFVCFPNLSFAGCSCGGDRGGDKAGSGGFESSLSQDDLIFTLDNDVWGDTSSVEATPILEDAPVELTLDMEIALYQGVLTALRFVHGPIGRLSRAGLSVAGGAVPVQIGIAMMDGATSSYSKNPDASAAEISSQAVEGGVLTYLGGKLGGQATNNMADSIWKEILSTATGEGLSEGYSRVKEWEPRNVQPTQSLQINNQNYEDFSDLFRPTIEY